MTTRYKENNEDGHASLAISKQLMRTQLSVFKNHHLILFYKLLTLQKWFLRQKLLWTNDGLSKKLFGLLLIEFVKIWSCPVSKSLAGQKCLFAPHKPTQNTKTPFKNISLARQTSTSPDELHASSSTDDQTSLCQWEDTDLPRFFLTLSSPNELHTSITPLARPTSLHIFLLLALLLFLSFMSFSRVCGKELLHT